MSIENIIFDKSSFALLLVEYVREGMGVRFGSF